MSDIDSFYQQMSTMQKIQASLFKANCDMQQKSVEILDDSRDTASLNKGVNVDKCL
ncbi:MAG: hypothetical protein R3Y43_06085 [Alphaproteobacteria bacterium]